MKTEAVSASVWVAFWLILLFAPPYVREWCESWSLRKIPRHGGRPYLERRGREQTVEDARLDRERGTWRARLHHFVGPDDAGHHNHPFKWAFSIILRGSYIEEVLDLTPGPQCSSASNTITTRRVRFFNWIPNGKYHRITELRGNVWTLFITGPRVTSWGFWVPGRGHVHHKVYNKEQGNERENQDVE